MRIQIPIPSALGITPSDKIGACEAYRVIQPLRALEQVGWRTASFSAGDIKLMLEQGMNPFLHFDYIIMQRLIWSELDASVFQDFALPLRALGKTIIIDYDDDYTNEHRQVHDGAIRGLEHFSAITVSTPYLKGVMSKFNKNVRIVPNMIVPELFRGFLRQVDGLTIGLTGSHTHDKDWKAVEKPLRRIATEFPDTKLFVSGYVPEYLKDVPNLLTMKGAFPGIADDVEGDNFFIPMVQYPLIHANIDILLCPVDPDDRFNWSKSNLKAIEGQATARACGDEVGGCFVIASGDVPNYRDCIKDGRTGVLVDHHNEEMWYSAIKKAINDVKYRHSVQVAGHKSVLANWSLESRIKERVATLQEIGRWDYQQRRKVLASVAELAH